MSKAEKVAEHTVNAVGGALAIIGINVGGAVTIGKSVIALLSLQFSGDPATEARNSAMAATLAALANNPDFDGANSERVAVLLSEANFKSLTPAVLLDAVQTAEGIDIGPPLAAVLTSRVPFDRDDAATVAVVGLALRAAAQAFANETAFRDSLRYLLAMEQERRQKLQAQLMTESVANLGRLLAENDAKAQELGLKQDLVIGLARRVSENVADFDTALRELDRALTLAAQMRDQSALPSNAGDQVSEVLRRLSALNDKGELDAGPDLIAAELARLDAQKARLYQAAIDQDILRRDAASATRWLEKRLKEKNPPDIFAAVRALQDDWYLRGRDGGLNFEAEVAIHLARAAHAHATTSDQRGRALNDLGNSLLTLGQREAGTARLEDAVTAYRTALEEWTRDRVPLDWARAQMNLGSSLLTLGGREPGTARLEEAVAAYRAVLKVWTRDSVPLDWARAQMNLGIALRTLGEREPGTERLEEAVAAHHAALEERTRDRVPLEWARTQMNLGTALLTLGEREPGTARLEEAIIAYRASLTELRRDRVPLDWAMAQMNLGSALRTLGEREPGTERLEEAVTAYLSALEERTRDRVPLQWAMTQMNLGTALRTLGQREPGTARLEESVAAYRAALEEWTRSRVLLDWAKASGDQGLAMQALAERTGDAALAASSLQQLREAEAVLLAGGHAPWAEAIARQLPNAEALVARLSRGVNEG